jgi:outer membrane immunogenic protein
MYKKIAAIALASSILGLSGAASAADLGTPPAMYKAAPPYVPPMMSWTGFYLGGSLGGAWTQGSWFDSVSGIGWGNPNNPVFFGGGQVGANYQIQQFVIGLEGDFDWMASHHIDNEIFFTPVGGTLHGLQLGSNNRWITSVAARGGYAFDSILLYVKGGGAWVGSNHLTLTDQATGTTSTFSNGSVNTGWLVGGGLEWAFAHNWTVRFEYSYIGLSNRSFVVPARFPALAGDTFTTQNPTVQTASVGINYLFNLGNP